MRHSLLSTIPTNYAAVAIGWGAVAATIAGASIVGLVDVKLGVATLTACVVAGTAMLAQRGRAAARRANAHELALQLGGDGVWDYDVRTGSIAYDNRCAEMLGYDRGHVADRLSAWGKLVHPEDLQRAREALDDYLAGRSQTYAVDVRLRDVRGCWRRVTDSGRIVERNDKGLPTRMVGIHRLLGLDPVPSDAVERDETPAPRTTRPAVAAGSPGLRGAMLELVAKLSRARAHGRQDEANELCGRLERLVAWESPGREVVPLAAIVSGFVGRGVEVDVDLPIVDTDPTLVVEAVSLVMDELSHRPGHRVRIGGGTSAAGGHALRFAINGEPVDNTAKRLVAVRNLLDPLGAKLIVNERSLDLEFPA